MVAPSVLPRATAPPSSLVHRAPRSRLRAGQDIPPIYRKRADVRARTPYLLMTSPTFADFGMPAPVLAALTSAGITEPFPIQSATLPDSLAGRDVLGRGRTGSGKTYAFLLPLVSRLTQSTSQRQSKKPRALILAPTRELASQIDAALAPLAKAVGLRTCTVFGGVGANPQIQALRNGVDVVVACPGRLADHVRSGHCDLGAVEVTILDEADHMADLGFLPEVKRLLDRTPERGQRMLFSATLDGGVDVIVKRYLHSPVTHSVDSAQSPVSEIDHHVLHVGTNERLALITDLAAAPGRTVVFTRTKHGAKQLTKKLNQAGVASVELHGNLSQGARTRNLEAFSSGTRLDHGRHRHRRPRDPRRRRRPRGARRPARRAQGLPAPLGPYGARRCRGHGRDRDARQPGRRRAPADPQGRHQADHHQGRAGQLVGHRPAGHRPR